MALWKLCYVIVVDDEEDGVCQTKKSFWYTKSVLQSVLQMVGCKVHHAVKVSRRVFDVLELENLQHAVNNATRGTSFQNGHLFSYSGQVHFDGIQKSMYQPVENADYYVSAKAKLGMFDLYKNRVTVTVSRGIFLDAICNSLEAYHYVGPSQRDDIILACRLRERKESVTVLLCGTSGCGKSTLSSLLASRLGITTVVSTDSVRHMMRSFIDEKENPLLWASTYHAGEFLDPVAVAQAKARKKDRQLLALHGISQRQPEESSTTVKGSLSKTVPTEAQYKNIQTYDKRDDGFHPCTEQIGSKVLAIEGYKAQSEMVIDSLDRLITTWENRKESVVVEGVHLSLNFVMGLMKKHPSIIPFLIYISNEEKHLERFAIRAKYMTLDPSKNKYVKYIRNIRTIQDYLCKRAEKHLVPKVNNTNVDRSVASIHYTIFSCLRRRQMGVSLYDMASNTVKVINEEYRKLCDSNSIGSKRMFRMIQRQGSFRHYMAIVNSDGSVTKAWPFSHVDKVGQANISSINHGAVGSPIYGPLQVREAEHVNVQFGNYGIGSWPNDMEGTSYASSISSSRADGDEETMCHSSSTSSPLQIDGQEKELTEEPVVSESEEEQFQSDDDDDSTDSIEDFGDEFGGSVTESSGRSDEECEEVQKDLILSLSRKGLEEHKLSKYLARTLSLASSRKLGLEGQKRNHFQGLPLRRSRSDKVKNMNTPKMSTDL